MNQKELKLLMDLYIFYSKNFANVELSFKDQEILFEVLKASAVRYKTSSGEEIAEDIRLFKQRCP